MAKAKKETKKAAVDAKAEEKAAKRKARMEALKNRPAEQRPNSKQVDIIQVGENQVVKTYAMPVKVKHRSIGVMVTSVAIDEEIGKVVSTSNTFIPGELAVKVKKGHGNIVAQKAAKGSKDVEETDSEENETEEED